MKYFYVVFILTVFPLYAQSQDIDSLREELIILHKKISSIDSKIDSLNQRKTQLKELISSKTNTVNQLEFKKESKTGIPTKINFIGGSLRSKPSISSNVIANLNEGDVILIYDWFQDPFFRASYEGNFGYISYSSLSENKFINSITSKLENKDAEKRKQENPKLNRLSKKYGDAIAKKIINRELWIGMTNDMAIEVLGTPDDINRTTTAYGVREQWVYNYGKYLYFENGKLTSWQD